MPAPLDQRTQHPRGQPRYKRFRVARRGIFRSLRPSFTSTIKRRSVSCPNCGAAVDLQIKLVKITTCASCGTTLLLEDQGLRSAGAAGAMHDVPQLFDVGDTIMCDTTQVTIHGHARFSYGRGFWEEFWGLDFHHQSVWVSVDEGDVIVQRPAPRRSWPTVTRAMIVGRDFSYDGTNYTVIEEDNAECVALRGSFDEVLQVGARYRFINAQSGANDVLSGEICNEDQRWFIGRWIDPFLVVNETRRGS